jgi:tetratricopeptide (TPR) repeat protein
MKINYFRFEFGRGAKVAAALVSTITVLGCCQTALGASPSETLEKGVYSEETKGDLDEALKLYEQVISDAKGSQTVAAQAQYRLGVCYYKKKNFAEATAAFEKLVKDFPDQKDLIAKANEYLATSSALMPAPWVDGEELHLDVKLAGGLKIGTVCYSVSSGETNGQKIWRLCSRTSAGAQSVSRVEVEADSFKPIHSRWKHMLLGDVDAAYGSAKAELRTAGKDGVKNMDLNGAVLDNEEYIEWMRRLPLAEGYQNSARVLSSLGGALVTVKASVSGPEKLDVPAGSFDCYKVELNIGQTFWISSDAHRYIVKFEGGGAVAELASVRQQKAGAPVTYQDATEKFTLSAPEGWAFDRIDPPGGSGHSVAFVDPEAVAISGVEIKRTDKIPEEKRKSLRAWAESEAQEAAGAYKDFKVRTDSWGERTVGGQAAVSFIADYTAGKEKNVAYGVFTMNGSKGYIFETLLGANDFEAFKPQFDAIVDSYKAK